MHTLLDVHQAFEAHFSGSPLLVKACGRINIIGEHTDYNQGFVLPAAIDKNLFFALAENGTNECHFHALDVGEEAHFSLDDLKPGPQGWANYLMGILEQLQKEDVLLEGIDLVFGGDIPIGAGVSSSAALEAGFALGICSLFNLQKPRQELARLAQRSSQEFIGIPGGIMDQFASLLGRRGHALKLDCRSLHYEYIPLALGEYELLLLNTGVSHELANSAYKDRVMECRRGVAAVQQAEPNVASLRDVNLAQLEAARAEMGEVAFRRCRFVLAENERLCKAVDCLKEGRMEDLGELLFQTHQGLSQEYEVSCRELDFLVDLANGFEGVAGARMMGGGFGGCTLNLVHSSVKAKFIKHAKREYYRAFSLNADHYEVEITDGTDIIRDIPAA